MLLRAKHEMFEISDIRTRIHVRSRRCEYRLGVEHDRVYAGKLLDEHEAEDHQERGAGAAVEEEAGKAQAVGALKRLI